MPRSKTADTNKDLPILTWSRREGQATKKIKIGSRIKKA